MEPLDAHRIPLEFRLILVALLLLALLVAHTMTMRPARIGWFFERVFAEFALEDPEMLSSLRMLPAWADWYSDELTDSSLAREQELNAKLRTDLATLREYDRDALDTHTRLSYDMLEYFLAIQQEGERFQHHNHPLNQLFGVQNELPTFMATQHSIATAKDARNYVCLLYTSDAADE